MSSSGAGPLLEYRFVASFNRLCVATGASLESGSARVSGFCIPLCCPTQGGKQKSEGPRRFHSDTVHPSMGTGAGKRGGDCVGFEV